MEITKVSCVASWVVSGFLFFGLIGGARGQSTATDVETSNALNSNPHPLKAEGAAPRNRLTSTDSTGNSATAKDSFGNGAAPKSGAAKNEDAGWSSYGHDAGGARYSPAAQINAENVARSLKVAWTYRTGALSVRYGDCNHMATFETTPILVDGKLYLSTPYDHVIALEPETGRKLWEFDPMLDLTHGFSEMTSRGVSAWRDPGPSWGSPCALRIFHGDD